MAETIQRLKGTGYVAAALVRPDPERAGGAIGRKVAIASASTLLAHADPLEAGLAGYGELVVPVRLDACTERWAPGFEGLGFRSLLIVRIPVVSSHCFEFVMFTSAGHTSDESVNAATAAIMRAWPMWRATISAFVCPLTAREREALLAVAEGRTGAEAGEEIGVSERTFRLHVVNAKRKLFAANGPDAVQRAHFLCAF